MLSLSNLLAILQSNKVLSIYLHHIIDIIDINDFIDIFLFVCVCQLSITVLLHSHATISFPRGSYIKDVRMEEGSGVEPMRTDADTGVRGSKAMRTSAKITINNHLLITMVVF